MWLWPIFFYASWLILGSLGALTSKSAWLMCFFIIELPAFWLAGFVAGTPYRKRVILASLGPP
jgi:hypothetical protein